MATVRQTKSGGYEIRIRLPDGRRPSWYTGAALDSVTPHQIGERLDQLVQLSANGHEPTGLLRCWVEFLDDSKHEKLVSWGLAPPRQNINIPEPNADRSTLGPLIDSYIDERTDIAQSSRDNYGHARRLLVKRFGEEYTIAEFTAADAARWKRWLLAIVVKRDQDGKPIKTMAPSTVSKHVKRARTMFAHAVADRLIDTNPFDDVKAGSEVNRERDHFIEEETAQTILTDVDDPYWRLVFAFARYGGLRACEVSVMQWEHLDWTTKRMTIHSPKTGTRVCPIFPELLNVLRETQRDADPHRFCVGRLHRSKNLGTTLKKKIEKAQIPTWEKTMQNLRSSRRTELQKLHPDHVVNAWLGHSSETARKHYLQVTDEDFNIATGNTTQTTKRSTVAPPAAPPASPMHDAFAHTVQLAMKVADTAIRTVKLAQNDKSPLSSVTGQRASSYPTRT